MTARLEGRAILYVTARPFERLPRGSRERLDAARRRDDTPRISERTTSPETTTAERLARRWFGLVEQGSFEELRGLVDDDSVYVSKIREGQALVGRAAVGDHLVEMLREKIYEVVAERFVAIDENRIAVEGRMRWMDDTRVIHDDPVVWALEFRDGLLLRCLPVRSSLEAETALASRR